MKRDLPPIVGVIACIGLTLFSGYIGYRSCEYLSSDFKQVEWPEGSSYEPITRPFTVGGVALRTVFPDSISGIPVAPDEPLENIIFSDK